MFLEEQDTVWMEMSTLLLTLYFKMTFAFGKKNSWNKYKTANPSKNAEVTESRPKYLSSDL